VLMLAGHASLRDPYNPQGMVDQNALAKLTAEGGPPRYRIVQDRCLSRGMSGFDEGENRHNYLV
jgi:hypothetical protein